jgi:hypothetical protein
MSKYLKALYAALIAGLGAAGTAYAQGHGHIGFQADIAIATTVLTAAAVVWGIPNATKAP